MRSIHPAVIWDIERRQRERRERENEELRRQPPPLWPFPLPQPEREEVDHDIESEDPFSPHIREHHRAEPSHAKRSSIPCQSS
jgi:hypothetical protein